MTKSIKFSKSSKSSVKPKPRSIKSSTSNTMDFIYKGTAIEIGKETLGHICLDSNDKIMEKKKECSLLYGELLPEGLDKALDSDHLDASNAKIIYDLGMGTGKAVFQIFLSNDYKNISKVIGVELSKARYRIAQRAGLRLVSEYSDLYELESYEKDSHLKISSTHKSKRCLILKCDNLLNTENIAKADIIICDTEFPKKLSEPLYDFFRNLSNKTRVMSYLNFDKFFTNNEMFKRMSINKQKTDKFKTSWATETGHRFYLWNVLEVDYKDVKKKTTVTKNLVKSR